MERMKIIIATIIITFFPIVVLGVNVNPVFIENSGQLNYTDGENAENVQYYIKMNTQTVFFFEGFIAYVTEKEDKNGRTQLFRLDMLLNSSSNCKILANHLNTSPIYNYYNSERAHIHAQTYPEIVYQNVYPNIDLRFYLNDGQLKYDFIVKPGGRVDKIDLAFDGCDSISITEQGHLTVYTKNGQLQNFSPVTFQLTDHGRKSHVNSSYKINAERFAGFNVENYNKNLPLIIDPTQNWSTYYGGNNGDQSEGVTSNGSNVYITGNTQSTDLPTVAGSFQSSNSGGKDLFITKFDNSGNHLWTTYYGGGSDDLGEEISMIDSDIYITGTTQSSDFPVSTGAFQGSLGGGRDAFIIKMNGAGNRIWATFYGGSNDDLGNDIDCENGKVIVTGYTQSTDFPVSGGAFQGSFAGGEDAFVVKLDSSGTQDWATYYGGSANDQGNGVSFDNDGEVYFTGLTQSSDFPITGGAFQTTLDGGDDAFVAKLDGSGNQLWGSYYGGNNADAANSIDNNAGDSLVVVGRTESSDFPVSTGAFQSSNAGGREAFIFCMDESGSREWASYYGGSNDDFGEGVSVSNTCDSIYLVGRTQSSDFPTTSDGFQTTLQGGYDAFLTGFNFSGNQYYSTYYGGSDNDDRAQSVSVSSLSIYFTGNTSSSNFPTTSGAHQTSLVNSPDGFLASFNFTDCSSALPIELLSFEATSEDHKIVKCEWSTASEINNDYFVIQRSKNGQTFEQTGTIQGAGNSSTQLNYVFYDEHPYSGVSYYRLKQIDFDGKFSYSQIRSVFLDEPPIIDIYPNPSSGEISVIIRSPKDMTVDMSIYNSVGQNILFKQQSLEKGRTEIKINLTEYDSGTYFIRIKTPYDLYIHKQVYKEGG